MIWQQRQPGRSSVIVVWRVCREVSRITASVSSSARHFVLIHSNKEMRLTYLAMSGSLLDEI